MQTSLTHIQFNVAPANVPFYNDLMTFLGWNVLHEGDGMLGVADASETSLWFVAEVKNAANDYDGPGMNHLAIAAASPADVDTAAAHLRERGVELLFETPRHRPEFSESDAHTYYQIMFESPDRILFEFVYTGPKAA